MYTWDKQRKWVRWFHLTEYWYDIMYYSTSKITQFKALYGYEPPSLKNWVIKNASINYN